MGQRHNTQDNPRQLFYRVMRFESPGETLATLGGIWPSTFDRWVSEGMPPELNGNYPKLFAYFGLQPHIWSSPKVHLFVFPEFPRKVVRETEDKVTYVNGYGITCTEYRKDAYKSMPHFESFPVKDRKGWQEYRKRLVWNDGRVGKAWEEQKTTWQDRSVPLIIALGRTGSLYGSLRDMLGMEALTYLFYDDPELVDEMMDAVLELFLHAADALFTDFTPDGVCLWEDMAYNKGSLLSVHQVKKFMLPRYKVMIAKLRDKGIPFIFLDSDGYIDELIPVWLEGGIDGAVPMEVQCGMDVAIYRRRYPKLLMMGGVDKKALAKGKEAIDVEMEKIEETIASGGLIPWFDHGLPHDVSYQNFLYYVERLKEVTGQVN